MAFLVWLLFRPRKYVVPPPPQIPEPPADYSKDSAYYMKQYPELLNADPAPYRKADPPKEPPTIIVNITNNHLHNHLHVHLDGEETETP